MHNAGENLHGWPGPIVEAVRAVKGVFAWCSQHAVLGVPADWIVRFFILGAMHLVIARRIGAARSMVVCGAILLAKETFDIVAVLDPARPRWPGVDDLADILSGAAGIAAAEGIRRVMARRRLSVKHRDDSVAPPGL